MIFVGARYSFRAGFSLGVENVYIEKGSAESTSAESMCLDVRSSVIFKSGCFVVKAFAVQRPTIEVSALFQHHGKLRQVVSQRYREFHYVIGECTHLLYSVESGSCANGCPHGHI